MKIKKTIRGFAIANFTDSYGKSCSIQKSSLAMSDCIWLGIDDTELTIFENDNRSKYIETKLPKNWQVNNRMHLSQKQVKELLPLLENFVKTGDLK